MKPNNQRKMPCLLNKTKPANTFNYRNLQVHKYFFKKSDLAYQLAYDKNLIVNRTYLALCILGFFFRNLHLGKHLAYFSGEFHRI